MGKIFRLDLYLDREAPLFELKRFIIKIILEKNGSIKDSIPEGDNINANNISYYRIIYETNLNKAEIKESIDISDLNILCIDFDNSSFDSWKSPDVYINRDLNFYNIVSFYHDFLDITNMKSDKNIFVGSICVDIYGMQLLESLKKEDGVYIES